MFFLLYFQRDCGSGYVHGKAPKVRLYISGNLPCFVDGQVVIVSGAQFLSTTKPHVRSEGLRRDDYTGEHSNSKTAVKIIM